MPRRQKPPGQEKWTWDEIKAGRKKQTPANKKKRGEHFERAVLAFARTLDANAEVIFDHKVKDVDTGELRQCDVWINGTFGGHWPFSYVVSCKDHKRKLHVGDIGCFIDEIRSTNADMGVIYSRRGFNDHALKKARSKNVSCCRLFSNEVFDIPAAVFFQMFHCTSTMSVELIHVPKQLNLLTWNELLDLNQA